MFTTLHSRALRPSGHAAAAAMAFIVATIALPMAVRAGDPPTHVVRAIRQGSEIEFLGEIDYGSAAALEEVLAQNPQAKVLHLNSPGGEVGEAYQMTKSVEKRGLVTTVDEFCMSACTLVFLAGQQRLIAPNARVGFHRPWVPDMSDDEMAAIVQHDRDFMASRGVSRWLVDKAYATPNSSIWYPSIGELTTAKVIDGVTDKYVIAVGKFSTAVLDEGFALQQFLNAVQKRSPSAFKALHRMLFTAVTSPDSAQGTSFDEGLSDYLYAFMAHAEDRPLVDVVEVQARLLTRLSSLDTDICYEMLKPSGGSVAAGAAVKAIGMDDVRALNFVLMRAATNGANVFLATPSDDEAWPSFEKALALLKRDHPDDIAAMKTPGGAGHAAYCRAQAHFMAALSTLSPDDQGTVSRYLFGQQSRHIYLEAGPGAPGYPGSSPPAQQRPFLIHPDK
jgi:hypothetical protein